MLALRSEKVGFIGRDLISFEADDCPVFHDCGTWSLDQGTTGGCDGSLILAREAYTRNENNGLQDISDKLLALSKKWNVGVADTIVVAANVAVVTCPLGPTVRILDHRLRLNETNPKLR